MATLKKTATNIGNCCTTPILGTKTKNSINNNLFRSDFKEVIFIFAGNRNSL